MHSIWDNHLVLSGCGKIQMSQFAHNTSSTLHCCPYGGSKVVLTLMQVPTAPYRDTSRSSLNLSQHQNIPFQEKFGSRALSTIFHGFFQYFDSVGGFNKMSRYCRINLIGCILYWLEGKRIGKRITSRTKLYYKGISCRCWLIHRVTESLYPPTFHYIRYVKCQRKK